MAIDVRRGDIILVNLDPVIGSEQGKIRPALVIQNDIGNKYSPTTIVVPITSKAYSEQFPTNIEIDSSDSPLKEKSTILFNQIRAVDKSRIIKNYGKISTKNTKEINDAIANSLGLE